MSKFNRKLMACFNYSALGAGAFAIVATAFPIMAQSAESPPNQRPSKADMGKVSGNLLNLHEEYQAYQEQKSVQRSRSSAVFNPSDSKMNITAETVVIDAAASGDPEVLVKDLKALGAQNVAVFGRMVSGRLPLSAIPALKNLSSLQLVRPSYRVNHSGSVTSQGDKSMLADVARANFNVNGTGVKVGTLSDSYNCLGGADDGVANGDLPVGVNVILDDCPGGVGRRPRNDGNYS